MAEHEAGVGHDQQEEATGPGGEQEAAASPEDPGEEGQGEELGVVAAIQQDLPQPEGRIHVGGGRHDPGARAQGVPNQEIHPHRAQEEAAHLDELDGPLQGGSQEMDEKDGIPQKGRREVEERISIAEDEVWGPPGIVDPILPAPEQLGGAVEVDGSIGDAGKSLLQQGKDGEGREDGGHEQAPIEV